MKKYRVCLEIEVEVETNRDDTINKVLKDASNFTLIKRNGCSINYGGYKIEQLPISPRVTSITETN